MRKAGELTVSQRVEVVSARTVSDTSRRSRKTDQWVRCREIYINILSTLALFFSHVSVGEVPRILESFRVHDCSENKSHDTSLRKKDSGERRGVEGSHSVVLRVSTCMKKKTLRRTRVCRHAP